MIDLQPAWTARQTRELQSALIEIGFPLPRWGADGYFGGETLDAMEAFAAVENMVEVEDCVLDSLEELETVRQRILHVFNNRQDKLSLITHGLLRDVRGQAWNGVERGINPIQDIDTICLHQMACKDSDYQGWERWRKLAIHWLVTCGDEAAAYLLHGYQTRVWHGHGWNRRSIGFEFEGYFSGIEDDPRYLWQPKGAHRVPMIPTERQIEAGKEAIHASVKGVALAGGKIKYIAAHRQSYGYKESDPGSFIWRLIALPMMKELGLKEAPTLTGGKRPGKPIPEVWDPRNVGVPYR